MELIYIFRVLFRRKWIIILCSVMAVGAAFAFTLNQKKEFKSVAQYSTGFTDATGLKLSDEIFNLPQIDVKFNNVIENITSPKVLSLLSYRLLLNDLHSNQPFRKLTPDKIEENPSLQNINKEEVTKILQGKQDSMMLLNPGNPREKKVLELLEAYEYDFKTIKEKLYVSRYQRTDYIDIVFRSENPDLSAYVVNTLGKEFQRYHEAFRRERSLESMIAMDSLVKRRKADVDEKIANKARYLNDSVSSSLDPNMVGVNTMSQIVQLESSLADEQGKVQDLTYQLENINRQLEAAGGGNTNTGNNSEYTALRKQYQDLYDEYVKGGSQDAAMRQQLDDLRNRMNAAAPSGEGSTGMTSAQRSSLLQAKVDAEGKLRSANSKINFYRSKLSELRGQIDRVAPGSTARLDQLDKEIEMAQLEYSAAKEKYNIASSTNEAAGNNFKQTLYGQPNPEPEPSRRMVIMGLSGISAFILSSLVFIFLAYIDQSIKTPSQFQRQTDLKLLGTVNMINMKQNTLGEWVTHIEEKDEAKRNNAFRELLRKLRYEIERSGKRVILFTSTEPRQGKTTLSQALAFSLSLGKKKVLLLDTNFCNNDLTVYNKALPTLEQFTGNGQLTKEQFSKMVTKTPVENVDIIGCKGGDYTPTEILPKNHLLNYLPDLLKHYDYIFMEAAPLNGFTDTRELVEYADGVVAIFSAQAEVRQADKESIRFLQNIDGKFIGAILNKVQKSDMNL